MSSKGYATPLAIDIQPNKGLRKLYLFFVLHVCAVLLWLPLPLSLCVLAVALFLVSARMTWLKRPDLDGPSIRLVWDEQQRWWWSQKGEAVELALIGDSYLSSYLVVLHFRRTGEYGSRSLVLTPRAVGVDTFRRLLVRFRVEGDKVITPVGDSVH